MRFCPGQRKTRPKWPEIILKSGNWGRQERRSRPLRGDSQNGKGGGEAKDQQKSWIQIGSLRRKREAPKPGDGEGIKGSECTIHHQASNKVEKRY